MQRHENHRRLTTHHPPTTTMIDLTKPPAPAPAPAPHTQINLDAFSARLAIEYTELFKNDPEYAYAAARTTPEALARKMTLGLDSGNASKDGEGIKRACRHFGIKHTYKAIRDFLNSK